MLSYHHATGLVWEVPRLGKIRDFLLKSWSRVISGCWIGCYCRAACACMCQGHDGQVTYQGSVPLSQWSSLWLLNNIMHYEICVNLGWSNSLMAASHYYLVQGWFTIINKIPRRTSWCYVAYQIMARCVMAPSHKPEPMLIYHQRCSVAFT